MHPTKGISLNQSYLQRIEKEVNIILEVVAKSNKA